MHSRRTRTFSKGADLSRLVAALLLATGATACLESAPESRLAPRTETPRPNAATPGNESYFSVSNGGEWDAQLKTDGSFRIGEKKRDLELAGKWETLPSGFLRLTIDTATENRQPSLALASGDTALALGAPGNALVLRFDGMPGTELTASSALIFLSRGECPKKPLNDLHWLSSRARDPKQGVAGLLDIDTRKRKILMPPGFEFDGTKAPASAGTAPMTLACKNGVAKTPDGELVFTRDNGAIVHGWGADKQLGTEDDTFAVATPADIPKRDVVAGNYIGLRIPERPDSFAQLDGFRLEVRKNGTMALTILAPDLESPAQEPIEIEPFRVVAGSRFFHGVFNQGTGHLVCLTRPHGELPKERLIYCTGSEDGGQTVFNLMAISEAEARARAAAPAGGPPSSDAPSNGADDGAFLPPGVDAPVETPIEAPAEAPAPVFPEESIVDGGTGTESRSPLPR